jgi:hypothetical protein
MVPAVPAVQTVQNLSFVLPRDAGEEKRWGLERSVAIERLERLELKEYGITSAFTSK